MSAGVCGKRRGFEELYGSSPSNAKRCRFSSSDEQVSCLLGMFPFLDPQLVEKVLRSHGNQIEDSIESLHALSCVDATTRNETHIDHSAIIGNRLALQDGSTRVGYGTVVEESKWVELFVEEMMNASNVDDARSRTTRLLVAFEHSIASQPRETEEVKRQEHASLKQHLQNLYNDNQILKKAVAIQGERHAEQEHKTKEAQHLKQVLSQYQEQARNLELSNYALTLHLQRAQESNSALGHFHPDIY